MLLMKKHETRKLSLEKSHWPLHFSIIFSSRDREFWLMILTFELHLARQISVLASVVIHYEDHLVQQYCLDTHRNDCSTQITQIVGRQTTNAFQHAKCELWWSESKASTYVVPPLRAREREVCAAVPTPESWPPDTPVQPASTSTSAAYDLSKPAIIRRRQS